MKFDTRMIKKFFNHKNTGKLRADRHLEASELLIAKKLSLFDKFT